MSQHQSNIEENKESIHLSEVIKVSITDWKNKLLEIRSLKSNKGFKKTSQLTLDQLDLSTKELTYNDLISMIAKIADSDPKLSISDMGLIQNYSITQLKQLAGDMIGQLQRKQIKYNPTQENQDIQRRNINKYKRDKNWNSVYNELLGINYSLTLAKQLGLTKQSNITIDKFIKCLRMLNMHNKIYFNGKDGQFHSLQIPNATGTNGEIVTKNVFRQYFNALLQCLNVTQFKKNQYQNSDEYKFVITIFDKVLNLKKQQKANKNITKYLNSESKFRNSSTLKRKITAGVQRLLTDPTYVNQLNVYNDDRANMSSKVQELKVSDQNNFKLFSRQRAIEERGNKDRKILADVLSNKNIVYNTADMNNRRNAVLPQQVQTIQFSTNRNKKFFVR